MPREMVVQADIGGITIAFTEHFDGGGGIRRQNDILDECMRTIDRARAKQAMIEKQIDVEACRETLRDMPEREKALIKERAEERIRMRAAWMAQHNANNKRSEFHESSAHIKQLQQFDAETQEALAKLEQERKAIEAALPKHEAGLRRQMEIFYEGKDRAEVIGIKLAGAAD